MRKICFVTGSRADYGILSSIMKAVKHSPEAELQIVATNMHLSPAFGMTVNEIEKDGFLINEKVESLMASDSPVSTVKSMALTQLGIADAFERLKPDLIVILGDRYEMLAVASAAVIFRIPIAHIHGGETTEGAFDDQIRHAITKLSTLHFASTEEYASRIIQMGEHPDRVFNVGAPGVDNVLTTQLISLQQLEEDINFKLGEKYLILAYHPVTACPSEASSEISELTSTLSKLFKEGYKILVTMPNSDTGSSAISSLLKKWQEENPENVKTVSSLGRKRFFSALKNASAIIGNSSAALIEAPSFHIPSLNIGVRQKGRTKGPSVIDADCKSSEISKAISIALSPEFQEKLNSLSTEEINPYAGNNTVFSIVERLINAPLPSTKPFVDANSVKH